MRDEKANGEQEWKEMEETWQSGEDARGAEGNGRKLRRRAVYLQGWVAAAAAISVAVFGASVWLLRKGSEEAYTFVVILWSAYFSAGMTWVRFREPAGEVALATVDALQRRARRLERRGQWLDFARTLVGVEVLIGGGFWMVFARGGSAPEWMTAVILLGGGLLYGSLWGTLQRVRRERAGLAAVAARVMGGK